MPGHLLDLRRQRRDLRTVAGVGRGDAQRQQVAERVHGHVDLGALALLVPVVAGAAAALRGGCSVRLSSMAAVG